MSARAAWRLEQLGFEDVYDYVPSKVDWFACAMPRAGSAAGVPWALDHLRTAPTCSPDDCLGDVSERVREPKERGSVRRSSVLLSRRSPG